MKKQAELDFFSGGSRGEHLHFLLFLASGDCPHFPALDSIPSSKPVMAHPVFSYTASL